MEAAKLAFSGAFGAMLRVFHVHPGSWWRVLLVLLSGTIMALVFAETVAAWTGLGLLPAGVIVGLSGLSIASAVLKAAEKVEIKAVFGFEKKD